MSFNNNAVMIGAVCGSIFQIVLCVGAISGCVALCCWCHKKCRKRRQQQNPVNVVYIPTPAPPAGYAAPYPNYPPAPVLLSDPSAPPPSYQEATSPGVILDVPLSPPVYSALPQTEQQPFNPQYCAPKYPHTQAYCAPKYPHTQAYCAPKYPHTQAYCVSLEL